MKIIKRVVPIFLSLLLFGYTVLACGPDFDHAYLVRGTETSFLATPEGNFLFELENISGKKKHEPSDDKEPLENTAAADINDLEEALIKANILEKPRQDAIRSYKDARLKILDYFNDYPIYTEYEWYGGTFRHHERLIGAKKRRPLNISLNLDSTIPEEFRLYIEGAVAYYNYDFNNAIELWIKILSLPADERQYRSVWASFMIGKSYISIRNQKQAIIYFIQTRNLANQGFKDSLNLSDESYGWQALAELELKDYKSAIKNYLQALDANSISWIFSDILQLDNKTLKDMVKDDIARQVLASWIISHTWDSFSYGKNETIENTIAYRFLKAIEDAKIKGPIKGADRIAWVYYDIGDFVSAKEWLVLSKNNTALSKWINIKLLLRDGKIDESIKALQSMVESFEVNDEWSLFYYKNKQDIVREINEGLGILHLSRDEYKMAFEILLRGAYWENIAYVAEKVLTPEELEDILIQYKNIDLPYNEDLGYSEFLEEPTLYKSLEYLLARRYARMGNWDKAVKYMPRKFKRWWFPKDDGIRYEDINLIDLTYNLKHYLENAENTRLAPLRRAENYYQAGLLMRKYGMELVGTELEPDWFVFGGGFEYDSSLEARFAILTEERDKVFYSKSWWKDELEEMKQRRNRLQTSRGFFDGTEDEEQRVLASMPEPLRRFHYRYKAADFMWKAAELLPDNDILKSKALYAGGTYLKIRYPQEADKFYKALIINCPDTDIAKEAKKVGWFPKDIEVE
jgi:hypothetical protein